jgi:hypothetical protein
MRARRACSWSGLCDLVSLHDLQLPAACQHNSGPHRTLATKQPITKASGAADETQQLLVACVLHAGTGLAAEMRAATTTYSLKELPAHLSFAALLNSF